MFRRYLCWLVLLGVQTYAGILELHFMPGVTCLMETSVICNHEDAF